MKDIEYLKDIIGSNLTIKQREEILIDIVENFKISKNTLNFILDILINRSFDNNFNSNHFMERNRGKDVLNIIKKNDELFFESCGSSSRLIFHYIPDTEDYFEFKDKESKTYLSLIKEFDKCIEDIENLKKDFIKDKCKFREG